MPVRSLVPAALAAAALAALPAAASAQSQTTLASVAAPAPVAAYGGAVAWSAYDATTQAYTLTVSVGGQVQTPAVATRSVPFDVDAGPGPDGAIWLVYSRCTTEASGTTPAKGCDLYGYSLAGGATETRLANVNSSADETEPAISGSTVAFVRASARRNAPQAVYTGSLSGSAKPAKVGAAVPVTTCETSNGRCTTIKAPQIQGLDLAGKRLAAVSYWSSTGSNAVGVGQTALVLVDLPRRGRAIAFTDVGMNGQSLLGPSFAGNALAWFYGCAGYVGGCGGPTAGAWRYSLSSGRYALAHSRSAVQDFAALPSSQAVELLAGTGDDACGIVGRSATEPCTIVQTGALGYRTTKKPRVPVKLRG